MIKPDAIMVQEIKVIPAKAKVNTHTCKYITILLSLMHFEETMILLCFMKFQYTLYFLSCHRLVESVILQMQSLLHKLYIVHTVKDLQWQYSDCMLAVTSFSYNITITYV